MITNPSEGLLTPSPEEISSVLSLPASTDDICNLLGVSKNAREGIYRQLCAMAAKGIISVREWTDESGEHVLWEWKRK